MPAIYWYMKEIRRKTATIWLHKLTVVRLVAGGNAGRAAPRAGDVLIMSFWVMFMVGSSVLLCIRVSHCSPFIDIYWSPLEPLHYESVVKLVKKFYKFVVQQNLGVFYLDAAFVSVVKIADYKLKSASRLSVLLTVACRKMAIEKIVVQATRPAASGQPISMST